MKHWGQKYHSYDVGWTGHFIVWVLRGDRGTEYIIGERAAPPVERMDQVIARIGPIAYEEGQGLERFKERISEDVETASTERDKQRERRSLMDEVRREIEARIPKPPEPEAPSESETPL